MSQEPTVRIQFIADIATKKTNNDRGRRWLLIFIYGFFCVDLVNVGSRCDVEICSSNRSTSIILAASFIMLFVFSPEL